jgi:hypothetical protein
VSACVLLNISLYCGNRFWIYFVDFVAVSLVSWMVMTAVFNCVWVIRYCRFGKAVLSDDAFQVIMLVSLFVLVFIVVVGIGTFGSGGGWEYSFIVSRHLSDSLINLSGKKGNFLWITGRVGGVS